MRRLRARAGKLLRHPGAFALRVLKDFRANRGLLLAGAVAYNTLLSLVPLLILIVIVLSHAVDAEHLLATIRAYLEFVVPGEQAGALVDGLRGFLANRQVLGGVLAVTLIVFSAFAFTVLEDAMSVIFAHRVAIRRRHFVVSALMPYLFILFLGIGFLVVTVAAGALQSLDDRNIELFEELHSLERVPGALLYLVGVAGEILMLTAIYLVMPVGRPAVRHALIGGVTAALLWEITRHVLVWYYSTVSQVHVVYGALTTSIIVLLSIEFAAIVLLLGAQVIAEYERLEHGAIDAPVQPTRTGSPPA